MREITLISQTSPPGPDRRHRHGAGTCNCSGAHLSAGGSGIKSAAVPAGKSWVSPSFPAPGNGERGSTCPLAGACLHLLVFRGLPRSRSPLPLGPDPGLAPLLGTPCMQESLVIMFPPGYFVPVGYCCLQANPRLFSLGSKNSILKEAMASGTPKVSPLLPADGPRPLLGTLG